MNSRVTHKIRFPLDGHPSGYGGESLWADKISENTYQLKNIPIFAYGVNFDDVVLVKEDEDGVLQVIEKVESSNHHTIRVFFVDEQSGDSNFSRLKQFKGEGIGSEKWNDDLYALNVTPTRDYEAFIEVLNHYQDLGAIEYELAGEWSGGFDGSE
jgi:hypothetical protein